MLHVYTFWKHEKTVRFEFEEFDFTGTRAWWLSAIFLHSHFLPVFKMDKSAGLRYNLLDKATLVWPERFHLIYWKWRN